MATKIIRHVGADEVICTGDAFDDFGDTPEMVAHTCEWLEDFINNPNHVFIGGNHDIQYMYPYRSFQCSGYEQWKYFIVHDNINPKLWDKVKWFHFLDERWLLTHSGLHTLNVPDNIKKFRKDRTKFIAELTGWLNHEIRKGFLDATNDQDSWVFGAGAARQGHQRVGGITWCDFEKEFNPFRGMNQIMGHTPQMQSPRWCILENDTHNGGGKVVYRPSGSYKPTLSKLDNPDLSHNIDLDVHGNFHWATWNGKELKLGNYRDL
jgi:hypothetical protein